MKINFVHRPVVSPTPPHGVVLAKVHRPTVYKSLTTPPHGVVVHLFKAHVHRPTVTLKVLPSTWRNSAVALASDSPLQRALDGGRPSNSSSATVRKPFRADHCLLTECSVRRACRICRNQSACRTSPHGERTQRRPGLGSAEHRAETVTSLCFTVTRGDATGTRRCDRQREGWPETRKGLASKHAALPVFSHRHFDKSEFSRVEA